MIKMCSKYFLILELLVKQADNMEMVVFLDYKPTRYEGKGFLRKIRHLITLEMWMVFKRNDNKTYKLFKKQGLRLYS